MRQNKSLIAWREGKQTIGGWLSIGNAYTAELMASFGFDWLCIDMQHGMIDYGNLTSMLPAISASETTPLVRVPWNEPYEIMRALDAGAMGVIVPMVGNREEAERAVSACRYPPKGLRSFGPIRAALYGGAGYAAEANDHIACIVMVETREALEHLDEIVATPGIDGVYVGPSDLALALGMRPVGDNRDPEHGRVVSAILDSCRRHRVAAGIHTGGLEFTRRYLEEGFQFVTLGSDAGFLARAALVELRDVRKAPLETREKTGY